MSQNKNKYPQVFIHKIATALPPHKLSQDAALEFMQRVQGDSEERKKFLERVYKATAIEHRYTVLADYLGQFADNTFFPQTADLEPEPSTARRNDVFVREAENLALAVSEKIFARSEESQTNSTLHIDAAQVTHLITVSCTGFSAPGFDFALQKLHKFPPSLQRFHLGFMGCYASLPALQLAWNICRSVPNARVLIVSVELCTLHFQKKWENDFVIANALFADGAAACLVSAQENDSVSPLYELTQLATNLAPNSLDKMAWMIGDTGFNMRLSSYVPKVLESNLPSLLDRELAKLGITQKDVTHWAVHPGGRAILDRLHSALHLAENALSPSYETLRDFGNMSSATIFFVLKNIAEQKNMPKSPHESVFACAFGPGLTIASAVLKLLPRKEQLTQSSVKPLAQPLLFPSLKERVFIPELMDLADCDVPTLLHTIKQFKLLNRLFSANKKILQKEFFTKVKNSGIDKDKVYTMLDIGAGGGDLAILALKLAQKNNIKLAVTCLDNDARIMDLLKKNTKAYPAITVVQGDARALASLGEFDFIFCNHVLHHLPPALVVQLVETGLSQARCNFVYNDLTRRPIAYIFYSIFSSIFTPRSFARYDGRLSIRRSYTGEEFQELLALHNLSDRVAVKRAHPSRVYLTKK